LSQDSGSGQADLRRAPRSGSRSAIPEAMQDRGFIAHSAVVSTRSVGQSSSTSSPASKLSRSARDVYLEHRHPAEGEREPHRAHRFSEARCRASASSMRSASGATLKAPHHDRRGRIGQRTVLVPAECRGQRMPELFLVIRTRRTAAGRRAQLRGAPRCPVERAPIRYADRTPAAAPPVRAWGPGTSKPSRRVAGPAPAGSAEAGLGLPEVYSAARGRPRPHVPRSDARPRDPYHVYRQIGPWRARDRRSRRLVDIPAASARARSTSTLHRTRLVHHVTHHRGPHEAPLMRPPLQSGASPHPLNFHSAIGRTPKMN